MARLLEVVAESWPLARPFAISRGVKTAADVVVATINDGAAIGRGECVPYAHYGETIDGVTASLRDMAGAVAAGLDREALQGALAPGAARNALDCALWDLEAKQTGMRVWDLAGVPAPEPVVTAETIGIGTADEMAARAADMAGAPLIKVKLGEDDPLEKITAVREAAPAARLIVDPNEGWQVDQLAEWARALDAFGVEMLEQPVPAGRDGGLKAITSPVPLCADEACHTRDDLERLQGLYDMVNIKLDKTGGLTEALALKREAEAMGFGIMVGCMIGTSLAMAPATLLAQGAAIVDLDGPLLLKNDRVPGLTFADGQIHPPDSDLWG